MKFRFRRAIATLTLAILLGSVLKVAHAQTGGTTQTTPEPYATVEVSVTQYVWSLIRDSSGQALCTAIVEHDGSPTYYETLTYCPIQVFLPFITPQASATPNLTSTPQVTATSAPPKVSEATLYQYFTWKFVKAYTINRTMKIPSSAVYVSLTVPSIGMTQPYAILTAYETTPSGQIAGIRGKLSSTVDFFCAGTECQLPINQDSTLEFWATSTSGELSQHVSATLRVTHDQDGYHIQVISISPYTTFNDSCASMWGFTQLSLPTWATFPTSPLELNTNKTFHYLTRVLMTNGVVVTTDCPNGGYLGDRSPNSCAVDSARSEVTRWQNQFDPSIWMASQQSGIPPRMLKSILEVESQYWPGNGNNYLVEFGLAQINYLGIDAALRFDSELFNMVCDNKVYDCARGYASMGGPTQAQIKGTLMNRLDSSCITCKYRIDLIKAAQSIPVVAHTLRANCNQAKYLVAASGIHSFTYEDMWRYTLVGYHSGFQCLYDALYTTEKNAQTPDWKHVSANLACKGAVQYVENLWDVLQNFESSLIKPVQPSRPSFVPTFTTPTPIPSPTPQLSNATLHVIIFIDLNGDGQPQPEELVNGLIVKTIFSDGPGVARVTSAGSAVFELSGRPVGTNVTVSVDNLFRTYQRQIPASGEITLLIRLDKPAMPTALP